MLVSDFLGWSRRVPLSFTLAESEDLGDIPSLGLSLSYLKVSEFWLCAEILTAGLPVRRLSHLESAAGRNRAKIRSYRIGGCQRESPVAHDWLDELEDQFLQLRGGTCPL